MVNILRRHKIKFIVIFLLVISFIGVSTTFAIQHDKTEPLRNTFELGEITTHIQEETKLTKTGIFKNPSVLNEGPNDALIRMRVNYSSDKLKNYLADKTNFSNMWFYNRNDGYYYYNKVVKPGNNTEPLFTEITGVTDAQGKVTKEFQESVGNINDFQITLYQEAVQTVIYQNGEIYEENGVKADVSKKDNITIDDQNAQLIWKIYERNEN